MDYLNGYIRNINNSSNNLKLKKMTIDKIKSYMSKDIFDFWCNCKDIAKLNGAKVLLLSELKGGIFDRPQVIENKYKYVAEYYLLCHLTGTEREDINSQK